MAPSAAALALAPLLALLLALSAAANNGGQAKSAVQRVPKRCDAAALRTAAETFRRCLQTNAELIFPTFNQSSVIVNNLVAVTALVNAEMRKRKLDTEVPAPTAATLGGTRLRVTSMLPFHLTVAYPPLAGTPRRGGGKPDHSVTSSRHETTVTLEGEVAASNGTVVFTKLSIAGARFSIDDFVVAEGGGEETVSMSKTTVSERIGLALEGTFLKFASLMLEILADPLSPGSKAA